MLPLSGWMSEITIVFTERVKKDYRLLPESIQKKFKKQVRFLADNPRHPSLQIHRIRGTAYWEFYVDKAYRCVFRIEGSTYYLLATGSHEVIDEYARK
jgi:mRNA-degrading endonuclease RelE of RelBE toxin-antitoxin system